MDLDAMFTGISFITIFVNGFSWRKRSPMGILTSIALAQISFVSRVVLEGWPEFEKIAMRTSTYDIMTAVLIVVGIWVLGYVAGGISLEKKEKVDDYPGKIIENVVSDTGNK